MADNPGQNLEWFGDRELRDKVYASPNAVLPTFASPIIGFHQDLDGEGGVEGGIGRDLIGLNATFDLVGKQYATQNGVLIEGFYDLFWKNRLHIIPTSKKFGNILSAQQSTFEVYNSGEKIGQHVEVIASINDLSSLGINIISGPVAFPETLGLGESFVYTYLVDVDGVATINDAYDVTFTNGVVLSHDITGSRILFFVFRPQEPFIERWEWRTDILEAADGNEHRLSVRDIPRQQFVHTFLFDDNTKLNTRFENTLIARLPNQVAWPVHRDVTFLTAPASITDIVLNVGSTANRQLRAGENVVILNVVSDAFEVKEILTFTATTITLTSGLLQPWAIDDEVIPLVLTYVEPWKQKLWPINAKEHSLSFTVVNNAETPLSPFATYRGDPLYTDELLLGGRTYAKQFDIQSEDVDFGLGLQHRSTLKKYPQVKGQMFVAEFHSLADFTRIRDFFFAIRGMQKRFWMSTYRPDFFVAVNQVSGQTTIETTNTGFTDVFNQGLRTDLEIAYVDGTFDRRTINSIAISGGGHEELTLDSALSQNWNDTNVLRTSLLLRMRLETDLLEFKHQWSIDGEVVFSVREIET